MISTTHKMLINATQQEELRVAIINGQRLENLDIERLESRQRKSNIYKAKVIRIEPSLEAAFVNYGPARHGFLPLKEVAPEYWHVAKDSDRLTIKDALSPGQEILVQVEKEERDNKGAALTTYIGLAGCYLVLKPNNPRAGGISRRIEGDDRDEIRDILDTLPLPEGMGVIVRTAGLGRSSEELAWDLGILLTQWDAILKAYQERPAPVLIHQESDVIVRAIRDNLRPDIIEILVDNASAYERAQAYLSTVRPDFLNRLKLYNDTVPLFNRYQIESQIESAFQREVTLDNGGSIAIDPTEALTAIDVNSAKATEGNDIEETAFKTNLAAVREIARQLRLRDIGGLVVIDLIDMSALKNQRAVETALREALTIDRARVQVGRISRFGLLEMSRQRLRPSLGDAAQKKCPRCEGKGSIRTVQSLALAVLRVIEDETMKSNTAQVRAHMPVDAASYLLNEKRQALQEVEQRQNCQIVIIPTPQLESPQYRVERVREDLRVETVVSYELIERKEDYARPSAPAVRRVEEKPMIEMNAALLPQAPLQKNDSAGVIQRLWSAVFGSPEKESRPRAPDISVLSSPAVILTPVHSSDEEQPRRHNNNNRNRRNNQEQRGVQQSPQQRRDNPRHRQERPDRQDRPVERAPIAPIATMEVDEDQRGNVRSERNDRPERGPEARNNGRRNNNNRRRTPRTPTTETEESIIAPAALSIEAPAAISAPVVTPDAQTESTEQPPRRNNNNRRRMSRQFGRRQGNPGEQHSQVDAEVSREERIAPQTSSPVAAVPAPVAAPAPRPKPIVAVVPPVVVAPPPALVAPKPVRRSASRMPPPVVPLATPAGLQQVVTKRPPTVPSEE